VEGKFGMMNLAQIAGLFAGALLTLYAVRTIRVWLALRGLLELPNLVQIRRIKRPSVQ
jgi:hypothetical protein